MYNLCIAAFSLNINLEQHTMLIIQQVAGTRLSLSITRAYSVIRTSLPGFFYNLGIVLIRLSRLENQLSPKLERVRNDPNQVWESESSRNSISSEGQYSNLWAGHVIRRRVTGAETNESVPSCRAGQYFYGKEEFLDWLAMRRLVVNCEVQYI